jgi:acyl dehydratase
MVDYASLETGNPLEGLSIPAMKRVTLAQYAGAVDDYNPMHLDDKVASAAGKASVFAPTTLVMGYVGRMLQASFEGAVLRRYGIRMLKLVWPGDVLTCRGTIFDKRKEGKEFVVDVDVQADNQRGETVAKGRAVLVVAESADKPLPEAIMDGGGVAYSSAPRAARPAKKTTKKPSKKTSKKVSKKTTKKVSKKTTSK